MTGQSDPGDRSTSLFDLRYLIGGLFVVYGLVVGVAGLLDSAAEVRRSAGIRINLWTGIGMLVVGALFLAWARWRPLRTGGRSAAARTAEDPRHRT